MALVSSVYSTVLQSLTTGILLLIIQLWTSSVTNWILLTLTRILLGVYGVGFIYGLYMIDTPLAGFLATQGLDAKGLATLLKIGAGIWILNGLSTHFASRIPRKPFLLVILIALVCFGSSTISMSTNFANLRSTIASEGQEEILLSSVSSSFIEKYYQGKYTSQDQGTPVERRENEALPASSLNHQCASVARDYFLAAVTKMETFLNLGWVLVGLFFISKLFSVKEESHASLCFSRLSHILFYAVAGSLVCLIAYLLSEKAEINSAFKSFTGQHLGSSLQVKFANLSVGSLKTDYTITGKFAAGRCSADIAIVSNYGTEFEEISSPETDCTFTAVQKSGNFKLSYLYRGMRNVIDTRSLLRSSPPPVLKLNGLPLLANADGIIAFEITAEDLLTGQTVPSFKVVFTRNSDNKAVLERQANSGSISGQLLGNYYTAWIFAEGFRPTILETPDLVNSNRHQVFLVRTSFLANLLESSAPLGSPAGLRLQVTDTRTGNVCTVSRQNLVCPEALLITNEDHTKARS